LALCVSSNTSVLWRPNLFLLAFLVVFLFLYSRQVQGLHCKTLHTISAMAAAAPSTSTASITTPPLPSTILTTNQGPLPTSLALPTTCLEELYDFNTYGLGLPWTYMTQGCARSACCPESHIYSTAFQWLSEYYSPAVCPSQYRQCAAPSQLVPDEGETIRFCCPT
jgi:hypothetical protein